MKADNGDMPFGIHPLRDAAKLGAFHLTPSLTVASLAVDAGLGLFAIWGVSKVVSKVREEVGNALSM